MLQLGCETIHETDFLKIFFNFCKDSLTSHMLRSAGQSCKSSETERVSLLKCARNKPAQYLVIYSKY